MIRKIGFGLLCVALLVAVFGAGSAYAAGCFTDFNTAAACWMKNNGIATAYSGGSYKPNNYLTRGDAANFLFKANKVPPPAGDFHVAQSLTAIMPNGNFANASVGYWTDAVGLSASAAGSDSYQIHLTVPTSVYGRATRLKGVKICYDARWVGSSLNKVEVRIYNALADGTYTQVNYLVDATARTDATCRPYMFTTPSLMAATHQAHVVFNASFTGAGQYIKIRTITAILAPSATPAILVGTDAALNGDLAPDPGLAP